MSKTLAVWTRLRAVLSNNPSTPGAPVASNRTIFAPRSYDGMLPVLNGQETPKNALLQAMRNLKAVGGNILGTVMDNVEGSRDGYYYGYMYE